MIDEFPLRRVSTLIFLRVHIHINAHPFQSVAELLKQVSTNDDRPCCAILCIGGHSVTEAPLPEQLRHLSCSLTSTPVIVLSDREEPEEAVAAFREGARGYVPTSLEPRLVIKAIRIVLADGLFVPANLLMRVRREVQPEIEGSFCPEPVAVEHGEQWPPRQRAVLTLLIKGKANKEIALALRMEESTVKIHVRHIMRKLGVVNRTQAAIYARRLEAAGFACPPPSTVS